MKIFTNLDEIRISERTSTALGNFDGIHAGHTTVFNSALKSAEERGISSICFTFSNHPFNFIMNRSEDDPYALKLICSEEDKIRIIRDAGFDYLVNIPFDETMMKMRAKAFFDSILMNSLNAASVSVGFNYTYGARAEGTAETLRTEGENNGIDVNVQDAVVMDGKVVSSTLIRDMISVGNMELTARYLGRPLTFSGTVEHGKHIGHTLGYPTINLSAPTERALPPNGVYFTRLETNGRMYNAVTNIGVKPTIGNFDKDIETHVFDFDQDTYGKKVTVYFDHFSRGEVKFADRDALHRQIAEDCEKAVKFRKK